MKNATTPAVGRSVSRKDGIAKATGAARYADDLSFPHMLYGRTIRSTIAHGTVRSITLAFDTTGFTVVDYRDIPNRNVVALIADDQPFLVEHTVRHMAEPILLLAHADRDVLHRARVDIEYDLLAPVFDAERSTITCKSLVIEKGSVDDGMRAADQVISGTYRTGHQEHVYIEPNGVVAVPEGAGLAIFGSLQCPFYVLRAVESLMGPETPVRVVPTETGGGFGGKEEFPSVIAGHAALLALKSGRPVKMIYERAEDMAVTTKRHPSIVHHRTGVMNDGRIVAMEIDVLLDSGAYTTLSPVVLTRGCLHAGGAYRCDHVRINGRAAMTNTPPNGAFRGFGAPQTEFAIEVHIDRIAEMLGLDPVSIREMNALRPGDSTVTGQRLGDDASALLVLREAVARTDFRKRRETLRGTNRGIGLSLFYHGAGFTGDGERRLAARARVELTTDGVRVVGSSTDFGQGTRTIHAQIVADAMGIPYDDVVIADPDTSIVVNSGPTVASRTCMIVGRILQRCAQQLRETIGTHTPAEYVAAFGPVAVELSHEMSDSLRWDETTLTGDAYPTYSWGCDVVEVVFDRDAYEVRPVHVTAVHEFGRPIHPALAQGQIEGGVVQALGYALLEHVHMRAGIMVNTSLADYTIPTTRDTPPIDVIMIENHYAAGPFGAKGLGELPMNGPAPAVVNAIRHLGIDCRMLPASPEQLMTCASR